MIFCPLKLTIFRVSYLNVPFWCAVVAYQVGSSQNGETKRARYANKVYQKRYDEVFTVAKIQNSKVKFKFMFTLRCPRGRGRHSLIAVALAPSCSSTVITGDINLAM